MLKPAPRFSEKCWNLLDQCSVVLVSNTIVLQHTVLFSLYTICMPSCWFDDMVKELTRWDRILGLLISCTVWIGVFNGMRYPHVLVAVQGLARGWKWLELCGLRPRIQIDAEYLYIYIRSFNSIIHFTGIKSALPARDKQASEEFPDSMIMMRHRCGTAAIWIHPHSKTLAGQVVSNCHVWLEKWITWQSVFHMHGWDHHMCNFLLECLIVWRRHIAYFWRIGVIRNFTVSAWL